MNNLDNVLTMLRDLLGQRGNRKGRIFTDILSSVLILNSQEGSYRFVSQLIEELKLQDAVLLATLEEGMRPSQIQVAMQQLFDGFIELSLFKEGLRILPLIRIGKMRGMNPDQDYNTFSFTRTGARFEKAFFDDKEPDTKDDRVISKLPVEKVTTNLVKGEARPVFDYLSKSFSDDTGTNDWLLNNQGGGLESPLIQLSRRTRKLAPERRTTICPGEERNTRIHIA